MLSGRVLITMECEMINKKKRDKNIKFIYLQGVSNELEKQNKKH